MTSDSAPRPVNMAEAIALARMNLKGLLVDALAAAGIPHDEWFVLNALDVRGGAAPLATLTGDLAEALETSAASSRALIDALAAATLVEVTEGPTDPASGGPQVRLSARGGERLAVLRESISPLTAELLGPFEASELEAAAATLRAITERATSMRARYAAASG